MGEILGVIFFFGCIGLIVTAFVLMAKAPRAGRSVAAPGAGASMGKVKKEPKTYFVSLVGERSYQKTIRHCEAPDDVVIVREPDNPFDSDALCVRTPGDETIGYVPRDSWLRSALVHEGKGCEAWIDYIGGRPKGVRLGLVLTDNPIEDRPYRPAD